MPHPDFILVVPCYNEAARLTPRAFLAFVAARPGARLLFVDDGSTDGTPGILAELGAEAPEAIDVLRLPANRGKGAAVRHGLIEAMGRGAPVVGFWDADLATPLDAVSDFLAVLGQREEIEIVIGSRVMLMGRNVRRIAWRHYLGRACATLVSAALALPVYDTQCGAKMFRANTALAAALAEPFRSRWIFDVELLARYLGQPVSGGPPRRDRIYELVLREWHHQAGSKLRWPDYLQSLIDLVPVWRARRRGGS